MNSDDQQTSVNDMSVLDHFGELRNRLIYIIITVAVLSILCFVYSNEAFLVLRKPYATAFGEQLLIGTAPAEAFILKLKMSVLLGTIVGTPVIFYQIWLFVAPALYKHERIIVFPFVLFSTLLFLTGVAFCYLIVLPFALDFFHQQYQSIGITPTIKISEYLSLMIKALLGFGIVFELPVLCFFLGKLGIISDRFLWQYSRHAIVVIFFAAAFLTPPDILTQILMAGPLVALYFLSILLVKWVQPKDEQSND